MPMLEVHGLVKSTGAGASSMASISGRAGEIVGLLGPTAPARPPVFA